jgi:hypothetical protein
MMAVLAWKGSFEPGGKLRQEINISTRNFFPPPVASLGERSWGNHQPASVDQNMKNIPFFGVIGIAFGFSTLAMAADMAAFEAKAFEQAKAQGKTVVLAFHKDGCATCASQDPKVRAVLAPLDGKSVVGFVAKFDPKSELSKTYQVSMQSTLVVLKGNAVKAKAMGLTDEDKIRELVTKGL